MLASKALGAGNKYFQGNRDSDCLNVIMVNLTTSLMKEGLRGSILPSSSKWVVEESIF